MMDRFTWGFAIGAIVLCVLALASTFVTRLAPPPDPTTPAGIVSAYILAVRARDADQAWALLAPGANVALPGPPGVSGSTVTEDAFRQQVSSLQTGSNPARIRIVSSTETNGTARVMVEITRTSGGGLPLLDSSPSQVSVFELSRPNGQWLISAAPYMYQLV